MTEKRIQLPISEDACDPRRLLELVRTGDTRSLDAITRCYGARLLSAARRHCRTASEAEDAVQDALLSATGELSSFRGDGSLEGFLVRIVARACRRLSRGRKNDPNLHDADYDALTSTDSPESAAQRHELGAALDELLLALGADDRAILLLAELDGYTGPQIAAELGLSAGAVRTRLTRLRQRLREGLSPFVEPLAKPL